MEHFRQICRSAIVISFGIIGDGHHPLLPPD
jgi:hypothetical protein